MIRILIVDRFRDLVAYRMRFQKALTLKLKFNRSFKLPTLSHINAL